MGRFNIASIPGRIITAIIAVACLAGSYYAMTTGLSQLTEARQLERLPEMPVGALTTGPYVIAGKVTDQLGTLETPYSNTEAVTIATNSRRNIATPTVICVSAPWKSPPRAATACS